MAADRQDTGAPGLGGAAPAETEGEPRYRLLVTGGGTGGHIYPALAIAQAAAARGARAVLFVGARGGMEQDLVPRAGLDFVGLPVRGLVRKRPVEAAAGLIALANAVVRASAVLARFRPDVVVGTGGYAAGPVGLAALLWRIPLVLQEQNAVPGVTNRWLARYAAAIAVPYPEAVRRLPHGARVLVAGNPVRPTVTGVSPSEARRRLGLPAAGRVALMVAGSRGSAVFTRLLREMLPEWHDGTLLFISGRDHHAEALQAAAGHRRVVIVPYLATMEDGWAAADVVVCRAGAMTLAEIAAVGRPALLIPSPHVTHGHQSANAEVFAGAGAAEVVAEAGLNGRRLAAEVGALLADAPKRANMAAAARRLAQPDALGRIVDAVEAAALPGRRSARKTRG